jgi:hypothetical protein
MRNLAFALIALAGILLQACSPQWDESQLPPPVKDAFAKKFPDMQAKWQKEGSHYEAEFDMEGKSYTTVYGEDGTLQETEIEITLGELPDSARTYLQNHFKTEEIKELEKLIMPNGEFSFEAEAGGQELLFDSTGKFVKQEKD